MRQKDRDCGGIQLQENLNQALHMLPALQLFTLPTTTKRTGMQLLLNNRSRKRLHKSINESHQPGNEDKSSQAVENPTKPHLAAGTSLLEIYGDVHTQKCSPQDQNVDSSENLNCRILETSRNSEDKISNSETVSDSKSVQISGKMMLSAPNSVEVLSEKLCFGLGSSVEKNHSSEEALHKTSNDADELETNKVGLVNITLCNGCKLYFLYKTSFKKHVVKCKRKMKHFESSLGLRTRVIDSKHTITQGSQLFTSSRKLKHLIDRGRVAQNDVKRYKWYTLKKEKELFVALEGKDKKLSTSLKNKSLMSRSSLTEIKCNVVVPSEVFTQKHIDACNSLRDMIVIDQYRSPSLLNNHSGHKDLLVPKAKPVQEEVTVNKPLQEEVTKEVPPRAPIQNKVKVNQPEEKEVPSSKPVQQKVTNNEPVQEKVIASKPVQEKLAAVNSKPVQENVATVNSKPVQEKIAAVNSKPVQEKVIASKPVQEKVITSKPVQEKVATVSSKPVQEKVATVSSKPVQEKVMTSKPVQEKVATVNSKPVQEKLAVVNNKPVPEKVNASKPVQEKVITSKPVQEKVNTSKTVQEKVATVNSKPVEEKDALMTNNTVDGSSLEKKGCQKLTANMTLYYSGGEMSHEHKQNVKSETCEGKVYKKNPEKMITQNSAISLEGPIRYQTDDMHHDIQSVNVCNGSDKAVK
ncbi:KH domain-containing protein 3-like, partial [Homarus americanus]